MKPKTCIELRTLRCTEPLHRANTEPACPELPHRACRSVAEGATPVSVCGLASAGAKHESV